eukprot:643919-Pleurochrysis_carterae.AAC.1
MALRIGSGLCATKRSNFWSVACRWRRVLKRVYGARGYACVRPHEHHLRRMMAAETLSSDPLSMAVLQSVSAAMMAASSLCASSADSTTLHASSLLITSHTCGPGKVWVSFKVRVGVRAGRHARVSCACVKKRGNLGAKSQRGARGGEEERGEVDCNS